MAQAAQRVQGHLVSNQRRGGVWRREERHASAGPVQGRIVCVVGGVLQLSGEKGDRGEVPLEGGRKEEREGGYVIVSVSVSEGEICNCLCNACSSAGAGGIQGCNGA